MLIPFWGQNKDYTDIDIDRFDQYEKDGKTFFTFSSLNDADIVIYPSSPVYKPEEFKKFQNVTNNKLLIAFFNDDLDIKLSYRNNCIIFRTSFYKKTQRTTEFALPGWSNDYGKMPNRNWKNSPSVGFCGQMDSFGIRESVINLLKNSNKIITEIIKRENFLGGILLKSGIEKQNLVLKIKKEYLHNMSNTDYTLCVRGGGNFSYRIYETLCAGRIPILINTDCVLPYDFLIDWRKLFPVINIEDISNIENILLDFHNSFNSESFIERQNLLRDLWLEYISPSGFFKNIEKHF